MLINPKVAIDEGWITGLTDVDAQLQPNAVEFTLDTVQTINPDVPFIINSEAKQHRGNKPVTNTYLGENAHQYWVLERGVYDGMSQAYVRVPAGVVVKLIIRSTFSRNGMFLTSGLYDTGFEGNVGFAIHNTIGQSHIEMGIRFGQAEFYTADSYGEYAGGYNHAPGTHWVKE